MIKSELLAVVLRIVPPEMLNASLPAKRIPPDLTLKLPSPSAMPWEAPVVVILRVFTEPEAIGVVVSPPLNQKLLNEPAVSVFAPIAVSFNVEYMLEVNPVTTEPAPVLVAQS